MSGRRRRNDGVERFEEEEEDRRGVRWQDTLLWLASPISRAITRRGATRKRARMRGAGKQRRRIDGGRRSTIEGKMRGTRSVNDREKGGGGEGEEDDIRVEEARSVPSPFLRFPRPPFPTTRPQNTALTTDITSEKPCRSGIPSRSDGESSRQTFHPFIFLPLLSTSPSFLPFCYGIDTLENSPDNPNITKTKRTTTSPWISKTFR